MTSMFQPRHPLLAALADFQALGSFSACQRNYSYCDMYMYAVTAVPVRLEQYRYHLIHIRSHIASIQFEKYNTVPGLLR